MTPIQPATLLYFGPPALLSPFPVGQFRFLKDHYVDGEYIFAGEIRQMYRPWVPSADVEPLDALAVENFYAQGPSLGACIRTQFAPDVIYRPTTYWTSTSPNVWSLTGLGEDLDPITEDITRIEDKGP